MNMGKQELMRLLIGNKKSHIPTENDPEMLSHPILEAYILLTSTITLLCWILYPIVEFITFSYKLHSIGEVKIY